MARAAVGPHLAWQAQRRGRRSTSCTWACVCVAGAAFGSCLKGWGVVARAAVGPHLAWHSQHFGEASAEIVAGAVLRACVCVAGAAFGSCLKGWDVVARAAVGPYLAWHSQHFGYASVKSWQAQCFVHLGQHLGAV